MIEKIKKSFAFRSRSIYEPLLRRKVKTSRFKNEDKGDVSIVILSGKSHMKMMEQCLISICISWEKIPNLYIISDGSIDEEIFENQFRWWPGGKSLLKPRETIEFIEKRNMVGIKEFAKRYKKGLKIAGICRALEEGKLTIYCDTDVLWFKGVKNVKKFKSKMCMAQDYQACYNKGVKELESLKRNEPMNSGVMAFRGQVDFTPSEDMALQLANKNYDFSDQTFFAHLNSSVGGSVWSKDQIFIDNKDKFSIGPTYVNEGWAARHYVGPVRHLFWRDAFFLRFREAMRKIKSKVSI